MPGKAAAAAADRDNEDTDMPLHQKPTDTVGERLDAMENQLVNEFAAADEKIRDHQNETRREIRAVRDLVTRSAKEIEDAVMDKVQIVVSTAVGDSQAHILSALVSQVRDIENAIKSNVNTTLAEAEAKTAKTVAEAIAASERRTAAALATAIAESEARAAVTLAGALVESEKRAAVALANALTESEKRNSAVVAGATTQVLEALTARRQIPVWLMDRRQVAAVVVFLGALASVFGPYIVAAISAAQGKEAVIERVPILLPGMGE